MVERKHSGPSQRETELLEAAYRYVLDNGLADLSLRPLAAAIGSSPRVLLFLFDSKEGLVRALLGRARVEELSLLDQLAASVVGRTDGLVAAAERLWAWLAAPEHRALLRLWAEAYARSLVEPDGAWGGFARATVEDWLAVLAAFQTPTTRRTARAAVRRTAVLALLRGALLDLLATDDERRVTAAVRYELARLGEANSNQPRDHPGYANA